MATVKLTSGKVVLKNGNVSCSCCDGPPIECCMYPAGDYDVLFFAADLPETLNVAGLADITKTGDTYYRSGIPDPYLFHNGTQWELFEGSDVSGPLYSNCLIGTYSGPNGTQVVDDNFLDDYTVSGTVLGGLSISGTLSRIGLCEWTGECSISGDPEQGIEPSSQVISVFWIGRWNINFFSGETHTPNESSPAGTYSLRDASITLT